MGLLRVILAIAVVLAHSGPIFGYYFVGGMVAVQAFFIISGFYMSLILNEKYTGKGSYKLFITNRLLRLYPIYWIVAGFIIILSIAAAIKTKGNNFFVLQLYREYFKEMHFSTILFLIFSNIFIFFQDIVMFLRVNWSNGLLEFTKYFGDTKQPLYQFLLVPQAWTLGVELMFYIIAPFIVRKSKNIIFLLILLSIAIRGVLIYGFGLKSDPWNYRFFPTELVFFLLGNVSYRIYKNLNNRNIVKIIGGGGGGGNVYLMKLLFAIVLCFTIFYQFIPLQKIKYVSYFFVFFMSLPFIFSFTKNSKLDRYIGELSYPIYISHLFVYNGMNILNIPREGGIGINLTILTIIFSVILNEFVAKKIEKIRSERIVKNAKYGT